MKTVWDTRGAEQCAVFITPVFDQKITDIGMKRAAPRERSCGAVLLRCGSTLQKSFLTEMISMALIGSFYEREYYEMQNTT